MPNYAVHDSDGNILRTLTVREDEVSLQPLAEGEYIREVEHARAFDRIDVETGSVVPQPAPELKLADDWVLARRTLYGRAEQQLEMVVDEFLRTGDAAAALQKLVDHNLRVKAAVPKDAEVAPTIVYTVDPIEPQEGEE